MPPNRKAGEDWQVSETAAIQILNLAVNSDRKKSKRQETERWLGQYPEREDENYFKANEQKGERVCKVRRQIK